MKETTITNNRRRKRVLGKKPLSILFVLLILQVGRLTAQSADLVLSPAVNNVAVGQNFQVNMDIDMLSGSIDVAEIYLNFDNTKLAVVSINRPSTAIFPIEALPLDPIPTINTNGQIRYVAGTTPPFPTADFRLLEITFTVIGGGGTSTTVDFAAITDLFRAGVSILNNTVESTINIGAACTTPVVTIANSPTCNGQNFNLILQSSSAGTAPFDLTINGSVYNNINVGGVIANVNPNVTLFGNTVPTSVDEDDDPVTIGVKFRSSVAGHIRGVRFFANATPSGTFTGLLYEYPGTVPHTPLATVTFSSVTGGAWNEALFPSPVAIAANTTYIIAYHTTEGTYTSTNGFFFTGPTTSGPLTALQDGADGGNSVYEYGEDPTFPINTFGSTNYWVDAIFLPSQITFDLTNVVDDGGCSATGAPLQSLVMNPCVTLPVTLLNLSASPENDKITVRWSTAIEENNKGFEVQRSLNGQTGWTTLGFVNGAGNSNSIKNYSYVDGNLAARRYYYQLKQVDIDGRFKYSAVVSAMIDGKGGYSLEQNFPNPVTSKGTWIRYSLPRRTAITLSLYDLQGRLVKVLDNGTKDLGTHGVSVDLNNLTKGVYYYKLVAEEFSDVKKLVIQ